MKIDFKKNDKVWAYNSDTRYWYKGSIISVYNGVYAINVSCRRENFETTYIKPIKELQ